MSKQLKKLMCKEYSNRYRDIKNWLVVNYKGLKAIDATGLRQHLRTNGVKMNIVKNSSAHITFKELGWENASKVIEGPVAVIYPEKGGQADDPITLAKAVVGWRDKNKEIAKSVVIQGGYAEGRMTSSDEVLQFARLPSREMLLSQLAGGFKAPMSRLAYALNGLPQKLVLLVKALSEKK